MFLRLVAKPLASHECLAVHLDISDKGPFPMLDNTVRAWEHFFFPMFLAAVPFNSLLITTTRNWKTDSLFPPVKSIPPVAHRSSQHTHSLHCLFILWVHKSRLQSAILASFRPFPLKPRGVAFKWSCIRQQGNPKEGQGRRKSKVRWLARMLVSKKDQWIKRFCSELSATAFRHSTIWY